MDDDDFFVMKLLRTLSSVLAICILVSGVEVLLTLQKANIDS